MRGTSERGTASGPSRKRGIAFAVGAVLVWSVAVVPVASASLVEKTTDTVRSTVNSIEGVLNDPPVPSPPSASPPTTSPATPPAPALPPVPARPPTAQAPASTPSDSGTPTPSGSGGGGNVPSADGVSAAVRDVAGAATGAVTRAARQAPGSVGGDDGGPVSSGGGSVSSLRREGYQDDAGATKARSRALDAEPGAAEASAHPASRATDVAPSTSLAIAVGEVVELQRWLTHVWPAIALGGEAGGAASAVRALGASLLEPAAATIDRLLFAAAAATTASGSSPLAASSPPNDRYSELLGMMSTDWKKILYRIALAVLLALLVFTVWKEFRPALRPRVR